MRLACILCLLAAFLSACVSPGTAPPPDAAHNSRNSLDWAGVYAGVLPCADCPGIKTRLTLGRDGNYQLSTQYIDRPDAPKVVRGPFTWDAGGSSIALDASAGGQRFMVGEGRLLLLQPDGSRRPPDAAPAVLKLVAPGADAAPAGPGLAQTLESNRWTLDSARDGQGRRIEAIAPAPGRALVFGFSANRLSIQGGCNPMMGGYQVGADGRLTVSRMASGMMACEPALMQSDAALAALLAQPLKVDLAAGASPVLRLVTAAGETLVLNGQATPESLYGPATQIFLEVAAQPVACSNPFTGEKTCLQVRDRAFDSQGLPAGSPSAWRPLYESIEGYTHQPGIRNVLRIKRFARTAAPAGTPTVLYVLDLTVESEVVAR